MDPLVNIFDENSKSTYIKGNFLGKGGFAKCYELQSRSGVIFAGKIIVKNGIEADNNREKLEQEITIHKHLNHAHVVKFHHRFEDNLNVYILIELCPNKSMLELHKRRKSITEPETRYFISQIALACAYLHENNIIHRDLKLANVFIDKDMMVKVGDFRFATKLASREEPKKTMSGTPNYIAPDILRKKSHSFEMDVWSLGCIMYTLLVGKPPFETDNLRDTYTKIKKNDYNIPFTLGETAHEVIRSTLDDIVECRPTMVSLVKMAFFKEYTPKFLPKSVLTTAPRFDQLVSHKPLTNIGNILSGMNAARATVEVAPGPSDDEMDSNRYIIELKDEISKLLTQTKIIDANANLTMFELMEESEDPTLAPVYWVSKWVDDSKRYGLGYQLIDGSNGVVFNDTSRMMLNSNDKNIQYIDNEGREQLYTNDQHAEALNKKIILLHYFRTCMIENLMTVGENKSNNEREAHCRLPYVKSWFSTESEIVFYLSNGTFQMNLFGDHTKLVLCPLMGAVTYIDGTKDFRTFNMDSLRKNGYTKEIRERLNIALTMIQKMSSTSLAAGPLNI